MGAVWFRRRNGATAACIGELRHLAQTRPADAAEFLAMYDDGRYGGDCKDRTPRRALMDQGEAARAASDAVDAYCAANPASASGATMQTMAERVAAIVKAAGFGSAPERIEITYARYVSPEEAFLESLDDGQKRAIHQAAREGALFGFGSVNDNLNALISVMANYRSTDA